MAVTTGKRVYPNKTFTVVTMMPKTLIPCGIPYIFGSVGSSDNDILPAENAFKASGIDILYNEVIDINCDDKIVKLNNGESISYDKLVLGTGSLPNRPAWLNGKGLKMFSLYLKTKFTWMKCKKN